jgi:predicted DNA-binding ribbon-helix-helix protein
VSLNALVAEIDRARAAGGAPPGNLSSTLRLYVLEALRQRLLNPA